MEKMEKSFTDLWHLLEDEKIFLLSGMDFIGLCKLMDVGYDDLDRYLFDELGFTGEEILMKYRNDYRVKLKERYGIVIKI